MNDLLRVASEADKRNLPTLAQLSENDIKSIWVDVSNYIERQMTLQKGVHVPGLGTFTFSQQNLDLGNKCIMIQRPIFLLSGKLAQSVGLKQVRPLAEATHLAVVKLNFMAVAQQASLGRDTVEGCIRETLVLLSRALAAEINVFLALSGIGVLYFKNNKVRMKFNQHFINAMDEKGHLLLAFKNRPGSSVSLLSGGTSTFQRPQTANSAAPPTACSSQSGNKASDKDTSKRLSPAPEEKIAGGVFQQRESKFHQKLQMKAASLSFEPRPAPPTEATDKPDTPISQPEVAPKLEGSCAAVSCTDHTRAGQELCYLCMQRAQRNRPVFLREQQQMEEKAQEKLLLLKAQQRDEQCMRQEQVKLNEQRKHAKQVAAFNLQMCKKRTCPLVPTSFIFPDRPLTPLRGIQQHRYMKELQSQIESRQHHKAREQQSRLLTEHVDRVQLVQEIAVQKAQQLQQKHDTTKHYKMALDTQVGDKKCREPPEFQSNNWFICTEPAASNGEGRERAQKLFQVNFSDATQRKKKEMQSRQEQLEKEREILKVNKKELIMSCINGFERKRDIWKSLQEEWRHSAKLKHQREEEERRFLRSAGQLLVDKLDQYKRCCQCKRKTANCGESNIWKASHHFSGSQFMI
ncbi:coiled-coil domain-containing protein 81-like [Brachionichthys hirsutus]|uniref:coiled-coil domain-containing protein 81-like n=1 Tax=Brachionichthys hirsutus TaxID=412623 RepID=UPI003604F1A5